MKFKPIEKSSLYGCSTCGTAPSVLLDKNKVLEADFMYGLQCVEIHVGEDEYYKDFKSGEEITANEILERFKDDLEKSDCFLLEFSSALHGEKYEYNKDDGNFYLVEQNNGWA